MEVDRSTEHGAHYLLTAPTRTDMAVGSVIKLGTGTTIVQTGNIGHSFRVGVIECDDLTYVADSTGGRIDFNGFQDTGPGIRGKRVKFIYMGSGGTIFNHLEPFGMLENTEEAIFHFAQIGGTAYLQFGPREYQGVALTFTAENTANFNMYAARSHNGWTDLTNFSASGDLPNGRIGVIYGTANSRIKLYDPDKFYDIRGNHATTGNELVGGGGGRGGWEYLSLDVTAVRDDELFIRVLSDGVQTFSGPATQANTVIYQSDGTTPLAFYANKNVLPIKVRTLSNAATTRNPVSYLLRQEGKVEARVDAMILNDPIIIKEMIEDDLYSNSVIGSSISTSQEFYDAVRQFEIQNLDLSIDNFTRAGNTSNAGSFNVVIDPTAPQAFDFDISTITINASVFMGDIIASQITIADGVDISDDSFTGQVNFTTAVNLTGNTFNNTVVYNDNTNRTITYDDVTAQLVRNDGTGQITILLANGATVATDGTNVTSLPAPTPSSIALNATNANWAIYDDLGVRVADGMGDTTYNNVGGVDSGLWTVVKHRKGYNAEIYTWLADDGSNNTFTFGEVPILRPEGGNIYSGGPTTGVSVFINTADYVQTNLPNSPVEPQVVIDAQQDFLSTLAGLDWIHDTNNTSAPNWGNLNGLNYILSITGFSYDSDAGATPASSLSAIYLSSDPSGSAGTLLKDNGGFTVISAADSPWDSSLSDHVDADTFGQLLLELRAIARQINDNNPQSS